MPYEIVRLTVNDYEELLDFIDLVFHIDFRKTLPILYKPTDESMSCQYAVKEGGRIRAAVGSFPMTWHVGGVALKVAGIGNVAVHPYHRSKGYMVTLMNAAIADMGSEGVDLSYLGGQRQRYQYFGYELCGPAYSVHMSGHSIKHLIPSSYEPRYEFVEMEKVDAAIVDSAYAVYQGQPARIERSRSTFVEGLRSFNSRPLAIVHDSGEVAGYLTLNGTSVGEIALRHEADLDDVLSSLIARRSLRELTVAVAPHETQKLHQVIPIADSFSAANSGNYRVFNFAAVVRAFLTLKAQECPLASGHAVIETELFGRHAVSVAPEEVSVTETDQMPDVVLSGMQVYQALFGIAPLQAYFGGSAKAQLLLSWFPLPLNLPLPDHV